MGSNTKITIVDYGCGNLFSLRRALLQIKANPDISNNPEKIQTVDKLVLPGVGAFADGMENLRSNGLINAISDFVSSGRPVLGICLGMQLLLSESFEFGHHTGLGFIPGKVVKLSDNYQDTFIKVPHIGWNSIYFSNGRHRTSTIFKDLTNGTYMYFVHSFCALTENEEHCIATTEYGVNEFCSAVQNNNILGVQFHPEISGPSGLRLLHNFVFDEI